MVLIWRNSALEEYLPFDQNFVEIMCAYVCMCVCMKKAHIYSNTIIAVSSIDMEYDLRLSYVFLFTSGTFT